ncbi:MAG TPA: PA domain-containing protein [Burkholderiaceae bacterium]|nr:PA domain-containing protein [Burkholderiaceae bacterium]
MRVDQFVRRAVVALSVCLPLLAQATANITIVNGNAPGVGFNDPTPVAPVGGNPGTTLGQQRINAFQYVASLWGAAIDSTVEIRILAMFEPLTCTATSAVLGSAGPRDVESGFAGAPVAGTWYHVALANKLAGVDLFPAAADPDGGGGAEIRARFNSRLGLFNDCLPGSPFYLGLDGNHGTAIDLVEVLLHEFGHGLGFSTVTDGSTGEYLDGHPSIYDHFAFDNTAGKTWVQMTDAERKASAVNARQLVWNGANVTAAAPSVLIPGTPQLVVNEPASIAGTYLAGAASFGEPLSSPGLTRQVMPVVENGNLGQACTAFDDANSRAVKNRIALVVRGTCTFVTKALNAQNAGAVGLIVVENVRTTPPADLGGTDPRIAIPAIRILLDDGLTLLSRMDLTPSNRSSGVVVRMGLDTSQLAGADQNGRVMLYTPNPFQPGSSVSHWDTSANRNLLMEPAINADLTQSVRPPQDLTLPMFKDIGW